MTGSSFPVRRAARRTGLRLLTASLGATALVAGPLAAGSARAATCVQAGPSGLTATMVVASGQTVTNQTVDATGCDIGIYLAPGTTGVTLNGVTVSGADNHGIYGQDVSNILIENSTVQGNGLNKNPNINEDKAIELDGATGSTIENNTVQNNVADGGIGIDDDGPVSAGALHGGSSTPVTSSNDTISGNTMPGNYGGCTIVVAAYSPGGALNDITVTNNNIVGHPGLFTKNGPWIGQIVVANDGPSNSISNVTISNNTVVGSALAGIVLHANAPGDTETGIVISGNTITANHWLVPFGPPQTTGIALQAESGPPGAVPYVKNTTISGNVISQQFYGVWTKGDVMGTNITATNKINVTPGGLTYFARPGAFTGYTLTSANGGIFTSGNADYFGGHPGSTHAVGAAPTRDNGGYWLADSAGNVTDYGDATNDGSLVSKKITPATPVVGIVDSAVTGHGQPGNENGIGYYLVTAGGVVYPFGDANAHGSLSKAPISPVVGMAVTPDGGGYWLITQRGGVFTFGDAAFFGSAAGKSTSPVVGIAASPDGGGYTLVTQRGGVFTFGDAQFWGSAAGKATSPVVGIAIGPPSFDPNVTAASAGYTLATAGGQVLNYGSAVPTTFMGPLHPAHPMVGIVTTQ